MPRSMSAAMRKRERTLAFPADAPCLDGHFPGNPVVPAVAILAELIAWTETELGHAVSGVVSARFRSPLVPGADWRITLEDRDTDVAVLTGFDGDRAVLNVRLRMKRG